MDPEPHRTKAGWLQGLPVRSRLFHLPPIGLGTAHVESLTGYVARLAKRHCVTSGTLMTREISFAIATGAPREGLSPAYLTMKRSGESVNGVSPITVAWVQAMQQLTLRADLRNLTLLTWKQVLPPVRLIKTRKRWCPECHQEQMQEGHEPYDHLLWAIQEVVVCPTHERRLMTECPGCRRTEPLLGWRARPGFCARCGEWLGSSLPRPHAIDPWDLRRARLVGELLAAGPSLRTEPQKGRVSEALAETGCN